MARWGEHHVDLRLVGFFVGEAALWWAAFALASLGAATALGAPRTGQLLGLGLWAVLALELGLYLVELHDVRTALGDAPLGRQIYRAIGLGLVLLGVLAGLGVEGPVGPASVAGVGAAVMTALLVRAGFPQIERWLGLRTRVFLVGEGRAARSLAQRIGSHGGAEVVGFGGLRSTDLSEQARALGADIIVVATDDRRGMPSVELLRCRSAGLEVMEAATLAARVLHRLPVDLVRPADLIYQDGFRRSAWMLAMRRLLSVSVSLLLLLLAAPFMALVALAIRWDSPGPILFRQQRVGRGGQPFTMLKFRTMRVDAETRGARWATQDDPRVTRIGRYLRRFRIDELPQLWNVLRGDMDLVGPRPERPEFVAQLRRRIPYYDLRHLVAPGITGYAQVLYPYAASVEEAQEKLQYDLYYVRHLSVGLDLYVLALTARVVLFGRGAR